MDFEERLKNYLESDRGKVQDFHDLVYNVKAWINTPEEEKTLSDNVREAYTLRELAYTETRVKAFIKQILEDCEELLSVEDAMCLQGNINKRAGKRLI